MDPLLTRLNTLKPHLHMLKNSAQHAKFLAPCLVLPVPRLPPRSSLGTPKILRTGATLHLGPIRLHGKNWRAVPCRADFFSACKWGFVYLFMTTDFWFCIKIDGKKE